MKISMALSEGEIDVIRSYSSMLHNMLSTRKTSLAVDVNSIIEYADLLYEDEEGELLFYTVKEFEDYPNIEKTSRQLCDSLLENFLRPFRRLYHSERRQALLDSINYALKTRISQRRSNEESLSVSSEDKKNTKTHSRKRKKKRHHHSHKENQTNKRNRHYRARRSTPSTNSVYRKQFAQAEDYAALRSMKPITNIQKRFGVVTPKHRFREMKAQTTVLKLATRRTKDHALVEKYRDTTQQTNALIKFFPDHDANRKEDERHIQSTDAGRDESERHGSAVIDQKAVTPFYHLMKKESEAQKKAERMKFKPEMLRKIVEGSSYSDEEASSLKLNLIEALLHRNRTFEDVDNSKDRQTLVEKTSVETEEEGALQRNIF